jgi:DNA-binding GntR family transcriptional regulator
MSDNTTLPYAGGGLQRQSSGEQAALYIRRLIFDGHLRPGTRVPQDEVAQALGVSRIPVREALIALEREGWVTIEMHRGAFINALDEQAVRDHYDLFGLVYGFAAQRALRRGQASLVDDLSKLDREIGSDTPEEVNRLAQAFHATVVNAAHSPRIKVVLRAMSGLVPGNFFSLVEGSVEVERKGHAAILRALKRGDGERAAEEYGRMMRQHGELVVKLFKQRGLFETGPAEEPAAGGNGSPVAVGNAKKRP